MNAYELADWVDEVNKPIVGSKTMKQVSDTLRKQADRIKVLEANHKIQLNINKKSLQYIEEVEELIKVINQEKKLFQELSFKHWIEITELQKIVEERHNIK